MDPTHISHRDHINLLVSAAVHYGIVSISDNGWNARRLAAALHRTWPDNADASNPSFDLVELPPAAVTTRAVGTTLAEVTGPTRERDQITRTLHYIAGCLAQDQGRGAQPWHRPPEDPGPVVGLRAPWMPDFDAVTWVDPSTLSASVQAASILLVPLSRLSAIPDRPLDCILYVCNDQQPTQSQWRALEASEPDAFVYIPDGTAWVDSQLADPRHAHRRPLGCPS
ncbi:MAG: hypothetical protein ACRDP4_00190 [Nocardioidaceae bacterium]